MAQPNWANRTLFHGDNLEMLRGMDTGTVHLVATDPPFNKGRDFHATPDSLASSASFQDRWSWKKDVHQEWIDQLEDDWPEVWSSIQGSRDSWGDDMGAFLCFMAVRLLEMRRVLKDTGSIYLHCDPTASHYLKGIMDAVFGRKNFRNEIVWKRYQSHGSFQHAPRQWGTLSDSILFYTKSDNFIIRPYVELTDDEKMRKFNKKSNGELYRLVPHFNSRSMGPRPNQCYVWRGFKNPHPSGWRLIQERLEEEYQKGNIVITEDIHGNKKLERRLYLKNYKGEQAGNVWVDIPSARGKERTGYPTQKPLALYERIIKASSKEGDVVLDPFAGCATTCVAAERLGRQWVGIDIWDGAYDVTIDRLKREGFLTGPNDDRSDLLTIEGHITYTTESSVRTDGGEYAVQYLKTIKRVNREPPGPKLSRADMIERLQDEYGLICRGCDREFDDPRYLQLDHNTPRADGGLNHISNRILLCGPCNQLKSNTLTLSGLRRENKKRGHMQPKQTGKTSPKSRQKRLFGYG